MADAFDMAAVTAALPDDKKTYNDNPFFGKEIPTAEYDGLTWIQKEKVDIKSKLMVLMFWGKYAKGDYRTVCDISDLAAANPDIPFVGVSCDADEEDAKKLLAKAGKEMAEQNIPAFKCDYTMAHDGGKKFNEAVLNLQGENRDVTSIGASLCFILQDGKIVWKEQFSSSWAVGQGQFIGQLQNLKEGKDLVDNGANPVQVEEETVQGDFVDEFASGGDY